MRTAALRRLRLAALAVLAAPLAAAAPLVVHVYHTNDVHGWIMPRAGRDGRPIGGAAVFKAWVDADKGPKLVLDAGDWWQGTPEGSLTKGEAVADAFNAVGYDAVEIGNHEFDAGEKSLRALIGRMRMPVLAANVYGPDGRRVPWARPRVVKEIAGIKFGIFGLLTSHMARLAFPDHIAGLTFRREVDEARDQVRALKRDGADVIVAVTHIGYEEPGKPPFEGDQTIARRVPGIDLIVGGHSHTSLTVPWRDPRHGTLVVQAGSYLTKAGRVALTIDPATRRVASSDDELVALDPRRLGEDPAVRAVVAASEARVGAAFSVVVATATAPLTRGDGGEAGLGSWMADCYRRAAGADAAFQNGGGIRADIPAGPVTLRALFDVMPFDNALVKLTMTGAALRSALDHGVAAARTAQVSGIAAAYRRGRPRRERLASVTVGGAPLDDGRLYSVVTLDFLVAGGDGYAEFGGARSRRPTGTLARDALRACAQAQGTIAPPPPGRLQDLGD